MSILVALLLGIPTLVSGFLSATSTEVTDSAGVFESVEVGVAELSPAGEAGGYAIPASASSAACTLTVTPNSAVQGSNVTVTFTGPATGILRIDGVSYGSGSSGRVVSTAGLTVGTHTFSLTGSTSGGGVTTCSGTFKDRTCTTSHAWSIAYSCSRVMTVTAIPVDLVAENVVLNSGTLVTNQSLTFKGTVRNAGTSATSAGFSDQFSYRYEPSGAWTAFSTVAQAALGAGVSADNTSSAVSFATPGTVTVRLCADSASGIAESDETNNCATQSFVVTSPVAPSVTSCVADPNPQLVNNAVTWTVNTSGGTGALTYQWTGTDGLSGTYGTNTVPYTYSSAGTKNATVIVTDSLGLSSGPVACTALTVNNPPAPTVDLTIRETGVGSWADSVTVDAGDQVELQWTSSGADRCTGDAYFSTGSGEPTDGTQGSVSEPSIGSRVYTVTCHNDTYSTQNTDTATIDIVPPTGDPTLSANPTRIQQGNQTDITWNTNGNANCTISGTNGDLFVLPTPTGSVTSGAINGETVYTISCDTGAPTSSTVRIFPVFEEI